MAKDVPNLPAPSAENPQKNVVSDKLIKFVTFFGDASIHEESELYKKVYNAAQLLAQNGYGVVNGGGPGVMKAATDGAESVDGETVAVYWEPKLASIFEGKNLTNVTDESQTFSNYMMRTLGLIEKGQVYVVCRGGTGTMSEFSMVWALAKLYYGKHKPVILFGEFWKDIIDKLQEHMLIDDNELGVLHYATTKEEVLELVKSFELEVASRVHRTYTGDETPFVLSPRFDEAYALKAREAKNKYSYRNHNHITLSQLESFREQVKTPARVLVVGVGAGHDLGYLSQYYSVTGVEADKEMLHIAQYENPNTDIINMDVRDYEVQTNTFKGIWSRGVLHHLEDENRHLVFAKLAAGLVPGGLMHLIVREGHGQAYEEEIHAGERITRYYNYITELELRDLASKNGLEIVKLDHVERSHKWLSVEFKKKGE